MSVWSLSAASTRKNVGVADAESKKGKDMKKAITVLAVLAIGFLATQASAAPFALVTMTDLDGNALVQVAPGATVDYKITVQLNDIGTTNTTATPDKTITSRVETKDGIGTVRFNIQQSLADLVQVSFTTGTLYNGYEVGIGATGGTVADRGNGFSNLNTIWAVKSTTDAPGGANAPILVLTGSFTVDAFAMVGDSSTIRMTYKIPTLPPGVIKFNNGLSVVAKSTDADPYFGFTGLTVEIIPEPATLAVLGLGGALLAIRRKR